MSIKFDYFREPKLQFGDFFEHEDTKTGLAEFGPFGKCVKGLHPSQINLGFVGTRETISGCKEWIEACAHPIESENIKRSGLSSRSRAVELFPETSEEPSQTYRREKILNPDFVGFNANSPFQCCFQLNERWEKSIPSERSRASSRGKAIRQSAYGPWWLCSTLTLRCLLRQARLRMSSSSHSRPALLSTRIAFGSVGISF